ncbi:MAG: hypothetical protein QXE79_06040 [Candidatus Bathyarchaeia archaeon]
MNRTFSPLRSIRSMRTHPSILSCSPWGTGSEKARLVSPNLKVDPSASSASIPRSDKPFQKSHPLLLWLRLTLRL